MITLQDGRENINEMKLFGFPDNKNLLRLDLFHQHTKADRTRVMPCKSGMVPDPKSQASTPNCTMIMR